MSPQAGEFLLNEVAPRIQEAKSSFQPIGSEDREELAQDTLAIAANLLESVEARGKTVTPGNIAYYAIKLTRQGRRSTGYCKSDPLHPASHIAGWSRTNSLEEPVRGEEGSEEPVLLGDVLACEAEDPAATSARNLDWAAFIATLDDISRVILECLADERPLLEVALARGLSRSTIQTHRNRLTEALRAFMGVDLLQLMQRPPQWRINIRATRERLACRYERRAA